MRRRLILSIALGILIPITVAFAGAYLAGDSPENRWLVQGFAWIVAWPLSLLGQFFPEDNDTSQTGAHLRIALYLAALFLDVLVYSLLIYGILWWRSKRKRIS
jgi:hypothetical protein